MAAERQRPLQTVIVLSAGPGSAATWRVQPARVAAYLERATWRERQLRPRERRNYSPLHCDRPPWPC